VALPAKLVQPGAQLAGVDEDLDQSVLGAVAEPPLDDFSSTFPAGRSAATTRVIRARAASTSP
jgi:hypothetical protein